MTMNRHVERGMKCWEKEDRCGDCPADHPENKCSEYKKGEKNETQGKQEQEIA